MAGLGGAGTYGAPAGDGGTATANSSAASDGGALARAFADGSGSATASTGGAEGLAHVVGATASAASTGGPLARSAARAATGVGDALDAGAADADYAQAVALAEIAPLLGPGSLLPANPGVAARFATPGSALFAGSLGLLGADAPATTGLDLFTSSLDFSFDAAVLAPDTRFMLGLLAPTVGGSGDFGSMRFEVLVEGESAVDVTFADLLEATLYFTDGLIDLSPWTGAVTGDLDISLRTEISAAAGRQFVTAVVGGAAPVPVPATGWLLVSALGALGWRGRRSALRGASTPG